MESIARLEWAKHQRTRNRWARKDEDVRNVRENYWKYRRLATKLGNEYNVEISKNMKIAIRDVHKRFKVQRTKLRKTVQKMYEADIQFDKTVEEKRKAKE